MSKWDREPIPERKWAIRDHVPLNQAGLFSGEGGTGKSIIELTKDVAHVAGKDWLGALPEQGPAIYIGAEDDKDELHIRLAAIAKHHEVTFDELSRRPTCAVPPRRRRNLRCRRQERPGGSDRPLSSIVESTRPRATSSRRTSASTPSAAPLRATRSTAYRSTRSRCIYGLEPPQPTGHLVRLWNPGCTAWHGAFLFRQYLKGVKPGDSEHPDNDLRQLEFKKNQYGPTCEAIALYYQDGLFLSLPGMSSLDQAAREAKAEEVFLDLLRSFTGQNRYVSDKTSPAYAPALFAKEARRQNGRIDQR
jgi:hypothetical protein